MATPNPVLSEMINEVPEKTAAADQNLDQINETQSDLEAKRDAIEEDVCGAAADDLREYLDATTLLEIQALYPANPPPSLPPNYDDVYLEFGPTYGTIAWSDPGPLGNITDWQFLQDTIPPSTPVVRYAYDSTSDPTITDLVNDFAFGNDYITRPLDETAAYGLDALIEAYEKAKNVVTAGKDKVVASEDVLRRYNSAS